ncbi:MAG: hypothetical protein ACYS9Y_14620 [Planctomycetota bacterium]
MDKHSQSIAALSTMVLAIVTVVLAFITWLYLCETKKQRLVMEKTISVDVSPMVFIDNVKTEFEMNDNKKCLDVKTLFVIKNSGKTEARNIQFSYILTYKNGKEIRNSAIPFQYLFPG